MCTGWYSWRDWMRTPRGPPCGHCHKGYPQDDVWNDAEYDEANEEEWLQPGRNLRKNDEGLRGSPTGRSIQQVNSYSSKCVSPMAAPVQRGSLRGTLPGLPKVLPSLGRSISVGRDATPQGG